MHACFCPDDHDHLHESYICIGHGQKIEQKVQDPYHFVLHVIEWSSIVRTHMKEFLENRDKYRSDDHGQYCSLHHNVCR